MPDIFVRLKFGNENFIFSADKIKTRFFDQNKTMPQLYIDGSSINFGIVINRKEVGDYIYGDLDGTGRRSFLYLNLFRPHIPLYFSHRTCGGKIIHSELGKVTITALKNGYIEGEFKGPLFESWPNMCEFRYEDIEGSQTRQRRNVAMSKAVA